MLRKIINIDKDKCNGCGLCASACHEGAIEMINGKAELTREYYFDCLGDCLPEAEVSQGLDESAGHRYFCDAVLFDFPQ